MAIINSLLRGQLKGRIGNNYFAHTRTATGRPATVMGTINSSPANPRSVSQMEQRARFANAVKFYKHAQNGFYRFAFEQKRPNESDYNAFMRYNVGRSPILPKPWVDDAAFPAFSESWLFSQGSLPAVVPSVVFSGQYVSFSFSDWVSDTVNLTTVGVLSRSLLQGGFALPGDIVTFVVVSSPSWTVSDDSLSLVFSSSPVWATYQFFVNLDDSSPIADLPLRTSGFLADFPTGSDGLLTLTGPQCGDSSSDVICAAFVVTRRGSRGLLACNSVAALSPGFKQAVSDVRDNWSDDEVLQSWQAQGSAVLQGSVADSGSQISSSAVPQVTSVSWNQSAYTPDALPVGRIGALLLSGVNLSSLKKSSFTYVGCSPSYYEAKSGGKYELAFVADSPAGSWSIALNGVTVFSGTKVAA